MRTLLLMALLTITGALVTAEDPPWTTPTWDRSGSEATFVVQGGTITVALPPATKLAVTRPAVLAWIGQAASGVAAYFGRFPIADLRIEVRAEGEGVNSGVTFSGRLIRIAIGKHARATELADDWVMTHEMIHLAFPDLDDRYRWMEEGLATYLEPVIRVRAGTMPAATMWRELVQGLPKGQPGRARGGLDDDHSWGRTYWGGAGYWLLADLRIREQTAGRRSIDDVLRAILAAGGDGSVTWPMTKILDSGRAATGVDVLRELHREVGPVPVNVDYAVWWAKLGIHMTAEGISFDDHAPMADMRRAIAR